MRYAMNADKDEWREFQDELRLTQQEIEAKKTKEGIAGLMKLFGN